MNDGLTEKEKRVLRLRQRNNRDRIEREIHEADKEYYRRLDLDQSNVVYGRRMPHLMD